MCKINTANYKNCQTENGISISGDRGRKVGFTGRCIPMLASKYSFWKIWHDNIGKIPERLPRLTRTTCSILTTE